MKNRVTKPIIMLLSLTLLISSVGCGNKSTEDSGDSDTTAAEISTAATAAETTAKALSHFEQEKDIHMETFTKEYGEDGPTVVSGDEFVINMNKLNIKDFEETNRLYYEFVEFTLTGKISEDASKSYVVALTSASVNGYQTSQQGTCELKIYKPSFNNGYKTTYSDKVVLTVDTNSRKYITKCTDIFMTFAVYYYKGSNLTLLGNISGHFYPYGEDQAVKYLRVTEDGDQTLADDEKSLAVAVGCDFQNASSSKEAYLRVVLYCVNKTADEELTFTIENAKVNGRSVDADKSFVLPADTSAYEHWGIGDSNVMFSRLELEKTEDVKSVTMDLVVTDSSGATLSTSQMSFTPTLAE